MTAPAYVPMDDHFVQKPRVELLSSRPQSSARAILRAASATALFRVWPSLILLGIWTTVIVVLNHKVTTLQVPGTLVTSVSLLLSMLLSYRTSSAYDRYYEGRGLWTQITIASRHWARIVWIGCPDTCSKEAIDDPQAKALDEAKAILEKKTMVTMAHAFACATKHYLRGEEGIYYEDLYHLVRFIPSLDLPSGIPTSPYATVGGVPAVHHHDVIRQDSVESDSTSLYSSQSYPGDMTDLPLHPARMPHKFYWGDLYLFRFFLSSKMRQRRQERIQLRRRHREMREGGGVGHNVPLEVLAFMTAWVQQMNKRKTAEHWLDDLKFPISQFTDALSKLERILTTPIPWAYSFHIWEITWLYCLILPFALCGTGWGWITIPGELVIAYMILGLASIGIEIENPFGYDRNDLNLDYFVHGIIGRELDAITARTYTDTDDWIFSKHNRNFGVPGAGADELQYAGVEKIRRGLTMLGAGQRGATGSYSSVVM